VASVILHPVGKLRQRRSRSPRPLPTYPNGRLLFDNVALGTLPASLGYAYFRGSTSTLTGTYLYSDGWIDNFQADVYYRNPAVSCPVP